MTNLSKLPETTLRQIITNNDDYSPEASIIANEARQEARSRKDKHEIIRIFSDGTIAGVMNGRPEWSKAPDFETAIWAVHCGLKQEDTFMTVATDIGTRNAYEMRFGKLWE